MKYLLTLLFLITISGCSIKKTDTTTEKILKHTANTPIYLIIGTGAIAYQTSRFALVTILTPPVYLYKSCKEINNPEASILAKR